MSGVFSNFDDDDTNAKEEEGRVARHRWRKTAYWHGVAPDPEASVLMMSNFGAGLPSGLTWRSQPYIFYLSLANNSMFFDFDMVVSSRNVYLVVFVVAVRRS